MFAFATTLLFLTMFSLGGSLEVTAALAGMTVATIFLEVRS